MLLGLYSLVQSVAPAATFHDTAGLLIHDLHLAVDHHILVVLVEHTVGLQQLLQGMYALTLYGVVVQQFVFLVETLLVCQTSLCLECRHLRCDVGQHEQLVIFHLVSQPCRTLIGQVAGVQLLVHHEVQRFDTLRHTTVVVLHVDLLRLQHT